MIIVSVSPRPLVCLGASGEGVVEGPVGGARSQLGSPGGDGWWGNGGGGGIYTNIQHTDGRISVH